MINHPNLLVLHPISADMSSNHRRGLERRTLPRWVRFQAGLGCLWPIGGLSSPASEKPPLLNARKSASAVLSLAVVTGAPPSIAAPMPEATTGSRSDS